MKVLISVALALFLVGCSSENKQVTEETAAEKKSLAQNAQGIKNEALETTKEVKEQVVEKTLEVKEEVISKVEETKEEVAAKVEEVKMAVSEPHIEATKLYQVCAGCHGADGSKAALGKSQVIKGWSAQKTADALKGYKSGAYGGAMKAIMVGQVSKLSDAEIEALAEHISKL
ncbi:MAG: c-type cytochrome [Sulfurimonas sp.]|jgi:cytochrome c553